MKNISFLIFIFFLSTIKLIGQTPYFQQQVDFKIDVKLNDVENKLDGICNLKYTNNSEDTLHKIFFHLWANAYKNNNTALAQQLMLHKNAEFAFSESKDQGGYDEIKFLFENKELKFFPYNGNIDVVEVQLSKPCLPHSSINIEIPFKEKIPKTFSRMGRSLNGYQISQWFPKPAVYDLSGWHPMPYLNQGEFYSEFGNYIVNITLPDNYIIAATGTIQTIKEQKIIESLANKKDEISKEVLTKNTKIPSSTTFKTVQFKAENVHDFAWFTDKGYIIEKSEVLLESGKKIDTYSYYTEEAKKTWDNSVNFVNRAIKFYSDHIGEYPYPQATAVFGPLTAGGGMEYPMITVINSLISKKVLDIIITHEIGHNWFYGILASNERKSPWMDEGVNSYYEKRYEETYYPTQVNAKKFDKAANNLESAAITHQCRHHTNQSIGSESEEYTAINYGLDLYLSTALSLKFMQNQLGTWIFDKCMQAYYNAWKFKHPQPNDMEEIFEDISTKNLDWFFKDLLTKPINHDYSIESIQNEKDSYTIEVKNQGKSVMPFSITAKKKDGTKEIFWFEGTQDKIKVSIKKGDFDEFILNEEAWNLDLYPKNNVMSVTGKPISSFKAKPFLGLESNSNTNIYYMPMYQFNEYDKSMLGITIHNIGLPGRLFEYQISPLYSFHSKKIVGNAFLQKQILSQKNQSSIFLRLNVRNYSSNYNAFFDAQDSYFKVAPSIAYKFDAKLNAPNEKYLVFTSNLIFLKNRVAQDDTINTSTYKTNLFAVNEIYYHTKAFRTINPTSFKIGIEHFNFEHFNSKKENQVRANFVYEIKQKYEANKSFELRIYGAFMLFDSRRKSDDSFDLIARYPGSISSFSQGKDDYNYESLFFGRHSNEGFNSRQVMANSNGGLKNAINSASDFGYSNKYLLAANLKVDLPFLPSAIPIKPYFDIALGNIETKSANPSKLLYSGGLMLDLEVIKIYAPLFYSKEIEYNLDGFGKKSNFFSKLTFSFDLAKWNPILYKKDILNKYNIF